VHDCDSQGEQFEISDFGGHFSGHMDGCARGLPEAPKTWHVLEYKTHNNKSFKKLQKEGVKKSKSMHYAQMQAYMRKTGMKRALYLAVNKDTDELYMERVYYDKEYCDRLFEKAHRVISSSDPPPRISERRDYYQCGWCDARAICHGTESPDPALPLAGLSCRQCCHATPVIEKAQFGCWRCEKGEKCTAGNEEDQPCKHHLILPGMITFADPTDHGINEENENYIEFTTHDGKGQFIVGAGGYSSKELRTLPRDVLLNGTIKAAKEAFGAEAKSVERDILPEYPDKPVWTGPSCDLFKEWEQRYGEELKDQEVVRKCEMFDYGCLEYKATETSGTRLVVAYHDSHAEIREGIPF
jgi:hypothetical protein